MSAVGGNVYVRKSSGTGFLSDTWMVPGTWGGSDYTWVGDFNGDDKTDIASAIGNSVYMSLSTGASFASETWTVPGPWGGSGYTWVGDFNGDGKTDIASAIDNSVYMNLSTGASFSSATWTVPGPWGYSDYTWVGDFNGDGKADIASAIGTSVFMNLSTGTAFTSATWTVPGPRGGSGYTWAKDFDGDGKTDIGSAIGSLIYMNLSTGSSFTSSTWGTSALADSTFSMVFMSDPQFNWSCQDEGNNTTNDYCGIPANRAKDEATQAMETNTNHASAIRAIHTSMGSNFRGVVINGDLTAFGSKDGNLGRFEEVYLNMGVPVWPGLGNHDYQNNVNDCGAKAWANWNYCAADMAQFLAEYARSSDQISNNDVTKYEKNFAQAQDQRNVSGSLAYSWDIGKFHFVQLNNYPTYTESFTRGYASGISSWDIDITSPAAWLNADLGAAGADRKIILNWHRFDVYTDPTARASLIAMLAPYAGSIEAIFVGHNHGSWGPGGTLSFPAVTTAVPATATTPAIPIRAAINVPVIYSGSAIYNRFIRADFDTSTSTGCKITINVINTSSGSPVAAGSSTIDCS